mgnify:CR=1 FL=1
MTVATVDRRVRRTRAALENSENRFRLAMKNAPIGEALVSPDGHWFSANEALCTMLGYTEAELAHITCPIGVPGIGGKQPEVIAASVAAQLLLTLG